MNAHQRAERLCDKAKKLGMVNPVTGEGCPSIAMIAEALNDAESNGEMQASGDRQQNRIRAAALVWEDNGEWIRGALKCDPKTTLFLIQRNREKPDRGTMTGGIIPDDEDGKGTNENALLSWLQGIAAPMYVEDFQDRLLPIPGK